jgi:hypothetical protein
MLRHKQQAFYVAAAFLQFFGLGGKLDYLN